MLLSRESQSLRWIHPRTSISWRNS